MKYILLSVYLLSWCSACSQDVKVAPDPGNPSDSFPQPHGWVNDFEQILDPTTEVLLTKLIIDHQSNTTNQISVITTASIAPYPDLETYARELSNQWGVGTKEKNNGVSITLSSALREVRISTGLGLEQKLTDAMCKKVIDELMVPRFKEGNYTQGLADGLKEVIRLLETP